MKIISKKHFYLIFAVISLLTAGILTFIFKQNFHPYKFNIDQKINRSSKSSTRTYIDLNGDGFSEQIRVFSPKNINNNYVQIFTNKEKLVEQINLYSSTDHRWIHYEDYNNDNNKEIFIFSQLNDSLFLTVYNPAKNNYLLQRQFVFSKPDSAKHNFWDIQLFPICLSKTKSARQNILFFIRGGYSIYLRGVYSYNIFQKKLDSKFECGAPPHTIVYEDINNDGNNEIIVATSAVGNISPHEGFHDQTKWLFVLDQNLIPVIKPQNFGIYPRGSNCFPIYNNDSINLFFSYNLHKGDNYIHQSFLMNSSGKIIDSLNWFPKTITDFYKSNFYNDDIIYTANYKQELIKIDLSTKSIKLNKTSSKYVKSNMVYIRDFLFDKNESAFLVGSSEKLLLVDKNLNIMAVTEPGENISKNKRFYSLK